MHLPSELREAIDTLSHGISLKELQKHSLLLSKAYANEKKESLMLSPIQKIAYLHARLPATYAALQYVLHEARKRAPFEITSLIDLGSGPGTALLASLEYFPLIDATLYEKDPGWAKLSEALTPKNFTPKRVLSSLENQEFASHDLFIASYFLNEIPPAKRFSILSKIWDQTREIGIIIEPGTPQGFEGIRQMRDFFIQKKAFILSPCTHLEMCPMTGGNWCHFSTRVERSAFHRSLKQGTLNFEDEKFSYLILSKTPVPLPQGRVVSIPKKQNKGVIVDICSSTGLESVFIKEKANKIRLGSDFH